jgi:hypothetical protein
MRFLSGLLLFHCLGSFALTCSDIVKGMNDANALGLLTESDRAIIQTLFEEKNEDEALAAAFEMLMARRLATVPEALRPKLEAILARRKYVKRGWLGGSVYKSVEREVRNETPEAYRGTLLDYQLTLHEFEHAIQHHLFESNGVVRMRNPALTLLMESGAASMEWELYSVVPADVKARLLERLKADKTLARTTRKLGVNAIEASSKSRADYVKTVLPQRYYTMFHVAADELGLPLALTAAAGLSVVQLGLVSLALLKCDREMENKTLSPKTPLFKEVCKVFMTEQSAEYEKKWNAQRR